MICEVFMKEFSVKMCPKSHLQMLFCHLTEESLLKDEFWKDNIHVGTKYF